jgi:superfamily II DNA or RNA helicase
MSMKKSKTSADSCASNNSASNEPSSNLSSYIGSKGYTIYKECLDVSEQRLIKDELTVRPYIPKSPIQAPAYPVYRETETKIYLPRFYGLKNYGEPDVNRLPEGDDINVPFKGDLRDYQLNIVDVYMKGHPIIPGGLLEIPCGRGKTVIALKIISERRKKTLVIVHKEFLMNQWIERIEQFLPSAKVGRIQGQNIDIDGKDIVIGMLQSLSMKDYPESMFHSFGLTIVDECHHISSEVFCRSLQKIITRYTLGLSATMQRKDGLTKVFKMFLGDIVYSEKRESSDEVLVKAIQYISNDNEFNKMCYDYRGNPAYSTMISKLCSFNPRCEFILQVLEKEMNVMPNQQVMILAHNKNILKYLHDAIGHRSLATVGYYVGGMKEPELKKSETCQVIIATYAMAAEALDIKTLTTLILATPKTDVVQAVGRILRVKHERPLVIDIIDSHDVFLSQWQKRRKYYASNNYKIMHTKSDLYASNKWTTFEKIAKKTKSSKGCVENVDATNLLGKGVAAAAKFINTIKEDDSNSSNDDYDDYDDDFNDETSKGNAYGKLSGCCFILQKN